MSSKIITSGDIKDFENALNDPIPLTRLFIRDIKPDMDTNQLFILGRITVIGQLLKIPAKQILFRKLTIKEYDTDENININLTGVSVSDLNKFFILKDDTLSVGDLLAAGAIQLELESRYTSNAGPNIFLAVADVLTSKILVLKDKPKLQSKMKTLYIYTKIRELTAPTKQAYVIGVVKFVKPPSKTRGSDYSTLITLIDESCVSSTDKLKCLLFARSPSELPAVKIGDVVSFHRLKIDTYQEERQGQSLSSFHGFSWIVFDGTPDATLTPLSQSHPNCTITEEDKEKVRILRLWTRSSENVLSQELSTISSSSSSAAAASSSSAASSSASANLCSVIPGQYFNLICQVVGMLTKDDSVLLKVWDGTLIKFPLYEQNMTTEENSSRLRVDEKLAKKVQRYIVDIWVFDNHVLKTKEIKLGSFVKFTNLHIVNHKVQPGEDVNSSVMVELFLHTGSKYGRNVTILDSDDKEMQELCLSLDKQLETLYDDSIDSVDQLWNNNNNNSVNNVDETSSSVQVLRSLSPMFERQKSSSDDEEQRQTIDCNSSVEDEQGHEFKRRKHEMNNEKDSSSSLGFLRERCMVTTATVITAHRHIKVTSINDVLRHTPPYKFRIQAYALNYNPKAETVEGFLKLWCDTCRFLSSVPTNESDVQLELSSLSQNKKQPVYHHTDDKVKMYNCPQCNLLLEYIYMIEFILDDKTGWLCAGLWKKQAECFFGCSAVDLFRFPKRFAEIAVKLNMMCFGKKTASTLQECDTCRPSKVECCLMSFHSPCGISYQIFDTTLSVDN